MATLIRAVLAIKSTAATEEARGKYEEQYRMFAADYEQLATETRDTRAGVRADVAMLREVGWSGIPERTERLWLDLHDESWCLVTMRAQLCVPRLFQVEAVVGHRSSEWPLKGVCMCRHRTYVRSCPERREFLMRVDGFDDSQFKGNNRANGGAKRGQAAEMAVATAQELRERRDRIRPSDWIRGVVFFYLEENGRLPSDPQVLHGAFAALKDEYPESMSAYRFAPDPVTLRSERLQKVLARLQLTRNTKKPNPDMPAVQYTEQGNRAIESHVLKKFDPEAVQEMRDAAVRLADFMPPGA